MQALEDQRDVVFVRGAMPAPSVALPDHWDAGIDTYTQTRIEESPCQRLDVQRKQEGTHSTSLWEAIMDLRGGASIYVDVNVVSLKYLAD